MTQAVRWNIDVILTDVTKTWLELRAALVGEGVSQLAWSCYSIMPLVDYDAILSQYSRLFLWTNWKFYVPPSLAARVVRYSLESSAGPFEGFAPPETSTTKTVAV